MRAEHLLAWPCAALVTVVACARPPSPPLPAAPSPPHEIAQRKPEPTTKALPKTDDELVQAIRRAAETRLSPDAAEAAVGTAAVNTRRNLPLEALGRVDIIPDEASGQKTLSFEGARDIVYWIRQLESKNPRAVGLMWRADGSVELFFGVILPP